MRECDVAIVGAGIIGTAVAYELGRRGASVTAFDCRPPGLGATQAAAGMLAPYAEGFERPILPLAIRSFQLYDEFIERVSADSGVPVDYHRNGSLHVATSDEPSDGLAELERAARSAGAKPVLLDAPQVRDLEPLVSPEIAGGVLIPEHGVVLATSLLTALTLAGSNHGVAFETHGEMVRVRHADGMFDLETAHDRARAKRVVVAAGSWSGKLSIDGVPPLPVRPVRGQLVHVDSPSPALQRVIWGSGCYIAPTHTGPLAVGATMEEAGFDQRATVAGVRDLLDSATELMPALWQATFVGVRVGLRPATPDELPIVGRSRRLPGLYYASGHFRNGILLAPLTALLVADLILEERADPILDITSPQRFGEY